MNDELQHIDDTLLHIIHCARCGEYGDAASGLNRVIVAFQRLQSDATFLGQTGGLLDKLNYSLETVFLMLQQKDWVALADVLEYEFMVLWQRIMNS